MRLANATAAVLAACAMLDCSSSSPALPGDAGPHDDGGDGGKVDISGMTDITVAVVQYKLTGDTPFPMVPVRAQVPGDPNAFIDTVTDAMGVAHFKLDVSKAPNGFDVTAAIAGFTAVTITNVTAAIPGTVELAQLDAAAMFTLLPASGAISNLGATHIAMLDAWSWDAVVTSPGATSYVTKFQLPIGVTLPLPVAAIEVDPAQTSGGLSAGTVIRGVLSMPIARPSSPVTIDVDMTASNAQTPQTSTVTINWPTKGLFQKSSIKSTAAPVPVSLGPHIGSGFVGKGTSLLSGQVMVCGIANLDVADPSTLHLQTFSGALSPDIAATRVSTVAPMMTATPTDLRARVTAHDLVGNPTLDIGALNRLAINGTSLGDATFEVDADGYDSAQIYISRQSAPGAPLWTIYVPGGRQTARPLPFLPAGVTLGELVQAVIGVQVVKYVNNASQPWHSDYYFDTGWVISTETGPSFDPTGR
jgi:hypothetical protein